MKHLLLHQDLNSLHLPIGESFQVIDLFSGIQWSKSIVLEENSTLIYIPIVQDNQIDITLELRWSHARLLLFGVIFSRDYLPTKARIHIEMLANRTYADIHLLSIALNGADILLDGTIHIGTDIVGVEWYLQEEQIILWSDVRIKAKPVLNVQSNDVKASHGSKIEKLDEQKLFYMMSKGLDTHQSQRLVLEWYLRHIFAQVDQFDEDTREHLLAQLLEKLW